MPNFLNFISEDIEAKTTLLSTMPVNTKLKKKKYNDKIEEMSETYMNYRISVKKYLDIKSKSLDIKEDLNTNLEKVSKKVNELQHARFILNPMNSYFEKMGFDSLVYSISNYHEFNFNNLNDIINGFLDKFDLVGIKLTDKDFNYTTYVYQYMKAFLEVRNSKDKKYGPVNEIFEKIYWKNPELIDHIELSFRKIIKKYESKFKNYITKIQKEVLLNNKITDYNDCLNKLKVSYEEYNVENRENISDIIDFAKKGIIDINNYLEDSKIRSNAYTDLTIDSVDLNDKKKMENFYENLEKLKLTVEEYKNYMDFLPIFEEFSKKYKKSIGKKDNNDNKIKEIKTKISKAEAKLEKLSNKVISGKTGLFGKSDKDTLNNLTNESIILANSIYKDYQKYDELYFENVVNKVLHESLTVSEVLNLYYSFDFYKKQEIKKTFSINVYDELLNFSDNFDLYAMNPLNIISDGEKIFDNIDVKDVIITKYRLSNINLNDSNLDVNELENLLKKIELLLRIEKIENSETTVEKIWFMVQVHKLLVKESE